MTISISGLIGHRPVTTLPLPPQQAMAYEFLFAANGVFLRAHNPYLSVLMPVHAFATTPIRGLESLTPDITLHHARLPEGLFTATLTDARTHRNRAGYLIEVLYFFALHTKGDDRKTFTVVKPSQQAGVAHVRHDHAVEPSADPILLELHTHGTLAAFWSDTDNRDEQGFRFYAVVGNLDRKQPTVRLRVGAYGYFWEVPLTTLFDLSPDSARRYSPRPEENAHDPSISIL